MTTLFGCILIGLSIWDYFFAEEGVLELYHAIGVFCVGIVLLLMPDDIPAFIRRLADKFIFKTPKPDEPK